MATPRKQKKASDLSRTRDLPEEGLQNTRGIFEKLGRLEQKQAQGWVHIGRKKEHETIPEERGPNVELEAFAGDLYRLIIGNRQPKLRATNEGGILSKEISEFKQIGKLGRVMSTDEAVRSGIAAAFVVSYFLQETDLHGLNIGVNKNNEIVRIDFDHSLQFESDKQFPIERIMKVPDHKALADAPGWANWEKTLEGLHSNELFIKDKIKYCLKIILLDDSNFKAIAQDHVSRANEERLLHVQKRREELEKFLKSNHEFKNYLSRYHASYWKEIKTEISEHNLEIQKDIDKLKRYIGLVEKTDPAHFVIPQELSKEKYQGFLSRDALLEKLNIELKSYQEHLLNIDAIHTHFQSLANFSPLHEAAERGQIERVSELLKDPTVRSDALTVDGSTALYVAAEHGHAEVVKMLLSEKKLMLTKLIEY